MAFLEKAVKQGVLQIALENKMLVRVLFSLKVWIVHLRQW